MSQDYLEFTWLDSSNESSRMKIYIPELNVGNLVNITSALEPLTETAIAYLMRQMTNDSLLNARIVTNTQNFAFGTPAEGTAFNELGLRVKYQDTVTGKYYHFTIPAPKMTMFDQIGTDYINSSAVAWVAFKTAFETLARSEAGNAVQIISGQLVGRNV